MEAFEPLEEGAFRKLCAQVEADLEGCLRRPIPLLAVDALRGLEGAETAALVQAHWARQGAETVAQRVGEGLETLRATLAQRCEATQPPATARSFELERSALRALLARDEAVLGLSAEGLGAEQQRRGVKRTLDGARRSFGRRWPNV